MWEKVAAHKEWNTGFYVLYLKKRDKLNCKSYSGITLLNIAYKVISAIISECINHSVSSVLEEYQCGFRCGSTVEHIFLISQLMGKCFEFNTELLIMLTKEHY
jgi:hypothetical protein